MDVTKTYTVLGVGAMDATKPYKFIGVGAMDTTKTYKFILFGAYRNRHEPGKPVRRPVPAPKANGSCSTGLAAGNFAGTSWQIGAPGRDPTH